MTTSVTGRNKLSLTGFTLLELLFVVAIIGILVRVTFPVFRENFDNLQLNSFSAKLVSFMNYLQERSVVEGRVISINFDIGQKQYWAQIKDEAANLGVYRVPDELNIVTHENKIYFYPDGSTDQVRIKVSNQSDKGVCIVSKGVFGGVKIQVQ